MPPSRQTRKKTAAILTYLSVLFLITGSSELEFLTGIIAACEVQNQLRQVRQIRGAYAAAHSDDFLHNLLFNITERRFKVFFRWVLKISVHCFLFYSRLFLAAYMLSESTDDRSSISLTSSKAMRSSFRLVGDRSTHPGINWRFSSIGTDSLQSRRLPRSLPLERAQYICTVPGSFMRFGGIVLDSSVGRIEHGRRKLRREWVPKGFRGVLGWSTARSFDSRRSQSKMGSCISAGKNSMLYVCSPVLCSQIYWQFSHFLFPLFSVPLFLFPLFLVSLFLCSLDHSSSCLRWYDAVHGIRHGMAWKLC